MTKTTPTPTPCCSKVGIKRGPWTAEEDEVLSAYIRKDGEGHWRTLPKRAGLQRCGKSCRLRWMNYLRPSVKRGHIAPDEEDLILRLHRLLGNRWSLIAGRIPGRTDNEIKNYWNTHVSKKLISQGIDPRTHKPLETTTTPPNASSAQPNPNNSKELYKASSSLVNKNNLNNIPNPNINQNQYQQPGGVMEGWEDDDYMNMNMCNEDQSLSSFLEILMNDQPGPQTFEQGSLWEAELIMRTTMENLGKDI